MTDLYREAIQVARLLADQATEDTARRYRPTMRRAARLLTDLVPIPDDPRPLCQRCGTPFEPTPGRSRPRKYCRRCSPPRKVAKSVS